MTKPLPKKIKEERRIAALYRRGEKFIKECERPRHRIIKIVPVKVRFPETGNRFWDESRFEHFLDALSAEYYWEGRDWKYYRRGNHFQFLVLNEMIFRDRKVEKIWTRYGLVPGGGNKVPKRL